ncbi:MAG: FAD-binding protein [Clostridia bacterium]|nr:FAD-binding protein [Clostridia bacterium]
MSLQYKRYDAIVIGSGAAGYNAAIRICMGGKSVAIVTEGINTGTSRNTGSDKQTYYKLGLGGDAPDSVRKMAENLFAGGSVDGDNALCEAALSARCFYNLCELGVPFPHNRYGEFVGYKTDHDPYARATSAGPLTSKFMTEALQKRAEELKIPVFDRQMAVEVLKNGDGACGLLCIDTESGEYSLFCSSNIVMATGGPAGIYADSVYPECHTGSTGLAIMAGASLQSMTEWQYGLASVSPRWNVSGTYMQVLPRFVSVDSEGVEREFLLDYFEDKYEALSLVFLKGYQWPFDSKKVMSGSSVIDLLVYRECVLLGRRVFLDFTKNPFGIEEIEFEKLSPEAHEYLAKANACMGTPIDRLDLMNRPAIELYAGKGVDITKEYLEIALCAQHSNGGVAVDLWWQSDVKGLFAAGECAGTHGVTRPGGSALNAGQVGSLRASQYICERGNVPLGDEDFLAIAEKAMEYHKGLTACLNNGKTADEKIKEAQRRMSDAGAAIRSSEKMSEALSVTLSELKSLRSSTLVGEKSELYKFYKLRDILITQAVVLYAMIDFSTAVGGTRGSALYTDENGDLRQGLDSVFRFKGADGEVNRKVQSVSMSCGKINAIWRCVREIPSEDSFFENVWRTYRESRSVY